MNILLIGGIIALIKRQGRRLFRTQKYLSLVKEFKKYPRECRYYNSFVLIYRLLTSFFLVFFYNTPYLQLLSLISLEIIHLTFLLKVRPHKERKLFFAAVIDQFIYLLVFILILNLHYRNQGPKHSESSVVTLGWVIIGVCITGLFASVIFMIIELYDNLKEIFKKYVLKFIPKTKPQTQEFGKPRTSRVLKVKKTSHKQSFDQHTSGKEVVMIEPENERAMITRIQKLDSKKEERVQAEIEESEQRESKIETKEESKLEPQLLETEIPKVEVKKHGPRRKIARNQKSPLSLYDSD